MKCASCYDPCSMNHTRKPTLKDFEVFDLRQKGNPFKASPEPCSKTTLKIEPPRKKNTPEEKEGEKKTLSASKIFSSFTDAPSVEVT